MDDDLDLNFVDGDEDNCILPAWHILITDDSDDVHTATVFGLKHVKIHGRPLRFSHAYSGAQAVAIVENDLTIDLMLLDAVMESENAGIECAKYIKFTLKRVIPTIVMRSGFAGWELELHKEDTGTVAGISEFILKSAATNTVLISVLSRWLPDQRHEEDIETIWADLGDPKVVV